MKIRVIDEAKFSAIAGKGGDGSIAFRSERYERKGGPDGGDGGKGGSIKLIVDNEVSTLRGFAGKDRFLANSGKPGRQEKRRGWDAKDMMLKVPAGTVIYVKSSGRLLTGRPFYGEMADQAQHYGLSPDPAPYRDFEARWQINGGQWTVDSGQSWVQVADLTQPGEEIVLARGGRGGLGNARFAHSRLTTPRLAQKGELGEKFEVRLELKTLADVGLVGLPNVGKSTLLSKLTAAHPEIADYNFTTLSPNLGVMESTPSGLQSHVLDSLPSRRGPAARVRFANPAGDGKRLVMADIPGLIEAAHEGKGLGIGFLKHVERCKVLVHILAPELGLQITDDGSPLAEKLWQQYQTVRQELEAFNPKMLEKPELVVLNKIDLVDSGQRAVISKYFGHKGKKILLASAITGEGLEQLQQEILSLAGEN